MLHVFGGKRLAILMAVAQSAAASLALLLLWPPLYGICVYLGESLVETGALGAGV